MPKFDHVAQRVELADFFARFVEKKNQRIKELETQRERLVNLVGKAAALTGSLELGTEILHELKLIQLETK